MYPRDLLKTYCPPSDVLGGIPPANNLKSHVFFWKPSLTTQRYFEPISLSLTFFHQLKVVGLLNSAHEYVRPSLLEFLFSDPRRAGEPSILVIIQGSRLLIIIVIEGSQPLTI